jgi:superfamily II DNA or RNA helicase
MYPPFEHQKVTTDFINNNNRCLITSDPGTGKTRSVLDAIVDRKSRTLVLAPLSILEASWGDDILKFTPDLTPLRTPRTVRKHLPVTQKSLLPIMTQ